MVVVVAMVPKIFANEASSRVELVFKGNEQVQEGAHAAPLTLQDWGTLQSTVPPDCTVTPCGLRLWFTVVVVMVVMVLMVMHGGRESYGGGDGGKVAVVVMVVVVVVAAVVVVVVAVMMMVVVAVLVVVIGLSPS
jgi:hypothetical protein